ncbi:radical SAM protein [bacterium]|nr:radical SAM protein [bacterium]
MPRFVLGTVVSDHDSAACLLADGKLVAAVNEERICRVRRGDRRNSIRRAMGAVLDAAGIELAGVDAIFCDTDHYFAPGGAPVPVFPDYPRPERIFQITHHVGHAASAFLASPFDDAAFLTVDASGGIAPVIADENDKRYWSFSPRELDFIGRGFRAAHTHPKLDELLTRLPGGEARNYPAESLTAGYAVRGKPMVELFDAFAESSLGYFYALCSHLLDMEEGSFMGLASYGRPGPMVEAMRDVLRLQPEGRIRIDKSAMDFWHEAYVLENPTALSRLSTRFCKTFGPGRKFFEAITPRHMDFAYAAQKRLEDAMVHVATHLARETGRKNLVLAGGVALNSVANGLVLQKTPFDRIFIQPAASDDGLALGNALFGHYVLENLPRARFFDMGDAALGPDREDEADAFVDAIAEGKLPVEYVDSLPYVDGVDVLWKGEGDAEYRRVAMERISPHRHFAELPIGRAGGVEYYFEVRAKNPMEYAKPVPAMEAAVERKRAANDDIDFSGAIGNIEIVASGDGHGHGQGSGNGDLVLKHPEPDLAADPRRPADPFEMFLYDHRDVAGILDGRRAFVGPEQVVIDPTNRCDNNCLACWTKSPLLGRFSPPEEWHREQMPADVMHRTIDELADLGTKRIRFTGGGEPFVHPQMIEFLEHVKARGMIAALTTNFTALTEKKVERMAGIGVDEVTASIWAGTADMYARSHPAKTQKTFEKIEQLLRLFCANKAPHAQVIVANVLFSMNYMEAREMLDFALRVGADGVYYAVVDPVADPMNGLLLNANHLGVVRAHLVEVAERVEKINRTRPRPFILDNFEGTLRRVNATGAITGDYDRVAVDEVPCYIGWIFCRILTDGTVVPCCRGVEMPMGNLHKQTFTDIWRGKVYDHFRQMALVEKKTHPFFRSIACHRTCDNLMHNQDEHRRIGALSETEKEHLVRFVVRGEAR